MTKLKEPGSKSSQLLRRFLSLNGSGVFLALVVYIVIISIAAPRVNPNSNFLSFSNILTVLRQQSYIGLMACGVTLVMITGNIDLSVGSANAFLACVCAWGAATYGTVPAIAITLAAGLVCGVINGALVGYMGFNSFITTLGTGAIYGSLAVIFCTAVSGGYITPSANPSFEFIGRGSIGVIPMPVIILAAVVAICAVILRCTVYGQQLYAIGVNPQAAYNVGIKTRRNVAIAYAVTGLLCGLSAVVMVSNIMSASPTASSGKEMDVILAVVLGGTSIAGGKGSIGGTVLGFLFTGLLTTGFTFLSLNTYVQWVSMGVMLIAALWLDVRKGRRTAL